MPPQRCAWQADRAAQDGRLEDARTFLADALAMTPETEENARLYRSLQRKEQWEGQGIY